MFGIDDLIIGGAVSGLGSLASSAFNLAGAGANRDWQERMSNTAYQRQVADMRKAGINPIMAAMKGGGASTPSGAVAQSSGNPLEGLGQGIQSASRLERLEKPRLELEMRANKADVSLKEAQAAAAWAQVPVSQATTEKLGAEVKEILTRADVNRQSIEESLSRMGVNDAKIRETASTIVLQRAQAQLATASAKAQLAQLPEKDAKGQVWTVIGDVIKDVIREIKGSNGKSLSITDVFPSGGNAYGGKSSAKGLELSLPGQMFKTPIELGRTHAEQFRKWWNKE